VYFVLRESALAATSATSRPGTSRSRQRPRSGTCASTVRLPSLQSARKRLGRATRTAVRALPGQRCGISTGRE
jgi:hypothetical protein